MDMVDPNAKCKIMKNDDTWFGNCVDDSMSPTYLGSSTLGPAAGGLAFDGWAFNMNNMNVTLAVTQGSCVPVLEKVKGLISGAMVDMVLMFQDVKPKVENM